MTALGVPPPELPITPAKGDVPRAPVPPRGSSSPPPVTPPGGGVDAPDPFISERSAAPVPPPPPVAAAPALAPAAFREPSDVHRGRRRWALIVGLLAILVLLGAIGFVVARLLLTGAQDGTGQALTAPSEGNGEASVLIGSPELPVSSPEGVPDQAVETVDPEEAVLDEDSDGLTVAEERFYGTKATVADSDGDSYTDGEEVRAGYDPLGPGKLDSDADGFPDPDERDFGSDPFNPDTDGDGFNDGDEIKNGYNPLIPSPGDKL